MKGLLLVLSGMVAFNVVFSELFLPHPTSGGVLVLWIMWCLLSGFVAGGFGAKLDNRS